MRQVGRRDIVEASDPVRQNVAQGDRMACSDRHALPEGGVETRDAVADRQHAPWQHRGALEMPPARRGDAVAAHGRQRHGLAEAVGDVGNRQRCGMRAEAFDIVRYPVAEAAAERDQPLIVLDGTDQSVAIVGRPRDAANEPALAAKAFRLGEPRRTVGHLDAERGLGHRNIGQQPVSPSRRDYGQVDIGRQCLDGGAVPDRDVAMPQQLAPQHLFECGTAHHELAVSEVARRMPRIAFPQ